MLDGRVKHYPKSMLVIHDEKTKHKNEMYKQNFPSIDLIIVGTFQK